MHRYTTSTQHRTKWYDRPIAPYWIILGPVIAYAILYWYANTFGPQ